MNRTFLTVAALGALAVAAPALAQPASAWQGVATRQAQLDERIDMGVRRGDLTREEAMRLRNEFRTIVSLESRYRANGLQPSERADLDRRFDLLSARIRYERHDDQARNGGPGWNNGRGAGASINQRQAILERRIDRGMRNGSLTRGEAARLRTEFRAIANLEARYRANGLQPRERADLDRRFDLLQARIRTDLADNSFRWDDYRYR